MQLNEKYIGIVEDINDPLKRGRCKVRIDFLHGDIETKYLPWANPKPSNIFGQDGRGGSLSIPKLNAILNIKFRDDDLYKPEYSHIQELAKDVEQELGTEYNGTHIFAFDGDVNLKMFYTKGKGLTFSLDDSRINIAADNTVTIEHKDSTSMIELDGGTITITSDSQVNITAGTRVKTEAQEVWENGKITKIGHEPQYAAVLGEPLFALLSTLAQMIDVKMYPTPNVAGAAVEQLKQTILSETVRVSK